MFTNENTPKESRQKIMKTLGEYGCYFLSLVRLAEEITEKRIDSVAVYLHALKKEWVDKEATVLNPAAILAYMTGIIFEVRKDSADYIPTGNEYEILLFSNGTYRHFVLGDGLGRVQYDPLGDSRTVAAGACIEKRIFEKV